MINRFFFNSIRIVKGNYKIYVHYLRVWRRYVCVAFSYIAIKCYLIRTWVTVISWINKLKTSTWVCAIFSCVFKKLFKMVNILNAFLRNYKLKIYLKKTAIIKPKIHTYINIFYDSLIRLWFPLFNSIIIIF